MTQLQTIDLVSLVDKSKKLAPTTKRVYRASVRRWVAFAGDDPKAWTGARCQEFYDNLLTTVSEGSANEVMWGVNYAMERASQLYGIPNVTKAVERAPEKARKPKSSMTATQAKALMSQCIGGRELTRAGDVIDLRDWTICLLGFFTGMRRSSLVGVDLSRVEIQGDVVYMTAPIKGGGEYPFPLHREIWLYTQPYRKRIPDDGRLFRSATQRTIATADRMLGPDLSEDGLYKILRVRAQEAKLPRFHPHLFRNTFITWCREAKIEDRLIKVITGHEAGMMARYTDLRVIAPVAVNAITPVIREKLGL